MHNGQMQIFEKQPTKQNQSQQKNTRSKKVEQKKHIIDPINKIINFLIKKLSLEYFYLLNSRKDNNSQ